MLAANASRTTKSMSYSKSHTTLFWPVSLTECMCDSDKFYPLGAVLLTSTPGYADTYSLVEEVGVPINPVRPSEQWVYDPNTGDAQLSTTAPEVALQLQAELVRYTALWQSLAPIFSAPAYQVWSTPFVAFIQTSCRRASKEALVMDTVAY